MKEITNLTEAVTHFLESVGGRLVRAENGANGPIAFVVRDSNGNRAYVFFKRDWLHSYGTLYPQEAGRGFGQTFNLNVLRRAANENAFLVVVIPSGSIYGTGAKAVLNYAEERGTIRTPSTEIAQEASVPSSMLRRIEVAA